MGSVLLALLLLYGGILLRTVGSSSSSSVSRLLQHHRLYTQQPPHTPALYHILQVPCNATTLQIQRSYRTLSRLYHPDKQQHHHSASELERVRMAYEILKDDTKRFLYHRHGVYMNSPHYPQDFLYILYPRRYPHASGPYDSAAIRELHRWMGWNDATTKIITQEERIQSIVVYLAEQMRPILESSNANLTLQHVLTDLAQQCDRCKYLPFGASILRCLGRAYQYEGRRALQPKRGTAAVRSMLRQLGHWSTAALAGSRVLLLPPPPRSNPSRDREDTDRLMDVREETEDDEEEAAAAAYLESLQMDALWKVYKMELDAIVRQACRRVLRHHPILPSYISDHSGALVDGYIPSTPLHSKHHHHTSATIVWTHTLRTNMAQILIRVGQVMVERSKVGTAWRA